ncbi:MAG: glycoside hydrolase family 2 TIM barrel-domain containing protein [Anaerocolumna sp.]
MNNQTVLKMLSEPQTINRNKENTNSKLNYYIDLNKYQKNDKWNLEYTLNGDWDFCYLSDINSRKFEDLFKDNHFKSKITVPGVVELQGFGHPQYVNAQYPWDGIYNLKSGETPRKIAVAQYKKKFNYSKIMNKHILVLDGAATSYNIWLNSIYVGYNEDSQTTANFNISQFLKDGENELVIEVYQYSSATWLEDQDCWRMFGIHRDIKILALDEEWIEDVKIECLKLNEKLTSVMLKVTTDKQISEKIDIYINNQLINQEAYSQMDNIISMHINEPKLWSAEHPFLYDLCIKFPTYVIHEKFGIRFFENNDGVLYLNNKRIVFKGVNRHDISSLNGKAVTKEEMEQDICWLKENNFNAVRSSHYPNQKYWYDLCDKYGLYVIDEVNLETHGTWQIFSTPRPKEQYDMIIPYNNHVWLDACLDRAKNMYYSNKNHPCILFWSCGNESFGGEVISEMSEFLRHVDNSRLIHYEGTFWNREYDNISDVESRMYATCADIEEYCKKQLKPFIHCEYTHAMGNSNGNIGEYIDLENKYQNYHGGFVWELKDHGLKSTQDGRTRFNFGGDYGDRPNDGNFVFDGLIKSDGSSTAKLKELKYWNQPIVMRVNGTTLKIKNNYLFTDLCVHKVKLEYLVDGYAYKTQTLNVKCKPLEKTIIELMVDKLRVGEHVVNVYIINDNHCTLLSDQHVIAQESSVVCYVKGNEENEKFDNIQLIDGDFNVGVVGDKMKALFNRGTGKLSSLRFNEIEYIEQSQFSLSPNFWRAPTDNDKGANKDYELACWYIASNMQKGSITKCKQLNESEVIISTIINCADITSIQIDYLFKGDGLLKLNIKYNGAIKKPPFYCLGFKMKLSNDFSTMKWYGRGKRETYIDRYRGQLIGKFVQNVDELETYTKPQEYGNHYETRWCEITNRNNQGIRISSEELLNFSLVPYNDSQLMEAYHENDLIKSSYNYLKISTHQVGVGGDNSWGLWTHSDYILDSEKVHSCSFEIRMI